eukprot:TRINITY_DN8665_c0_g1_i1.p1 TRINITY_DN8665_c0_g1~~TRINITY_DN8665_c0_g1_i1.p1  ORF type:complete len:147 (-),score=25.85 TRINITY_DN8665_c0_g1_i1:347-787(-)
MCIRDSMGIYFFDLLREKGFNSYNSYTLYVKEKMDSKDYTFLPLARSCFVEEGLKKEREWHTHESVHEVAPVQAKAIPMKDIVFTEQRLPETYEKLGEQGNEFRKLSLLLKRVIHSSAISLYLQTNIYISIYLAIQSHNIRYSYFS